MRILTMICTALALPVMAHSATAAGVVGGQTTVLLDTDLLSSAAMLNLSGVSDDVIAPGELGDASVAFGINPRDGDLPTSFSYEAGLASFSGAIEHSGSVFFNEDSIEVGDFSIGYDAARVGGVAGASGFFVESTAGIAAILFDVELTAPNPVADSTSLQVYGDLLVSPEFGGFLFDNQLSEANLAGADVGDAFVNAASVPEPSTVILAGVWLVGLGVFRRRRS